ncbi:MAG TPA: YlbF family regulator [Verrucomicrobiota bacterium]|nr:YlbF family regulator [Verrucomicrobiota bacterium]
MIMTDDTPVLRKTRELCQTILEQPDFQSIRQRIETFLGDEQARGQYDELVQKGQALQRKQQNSIPLTGEEIAEFERERDSLLNNPVARGFLDAQEELHGFRQTIQRYLNKTLELGRLPTAEDLDESSCGHGCSCDH